MDKKSGEELNELATEYLQQKDYDNALKYFEAAADKGNFYAMYNIACMYYFGDGVEQNDELAFKWYEKAFKAGDMEAANRVGVMYENGIGTEKDLEKAFEYYLKSAQMSSLSGMANVGVCFLDGKGTKKDINLGISWLDKASKGGNGIASLKLGNIYQNGEYDITIDYIKAVEYFERGKAQKYSPAVLALAQMYENGFGVEKDLEKSKELKILAETMPDED